MRTFLFIALIAAVLFQQTVALGCIAFLAHDGKLALGGNSEDWKDPATYLWFNPAEEDRYGRVSFGFGNLWPQGGVNDQGLFFDGMMTDPLPLEKSSGKEPRPHDVLDRMLRECATVDEAVKFLDRFRLPDLTNAMLFVGDRQGDSAIYEGDEVLRGDGRLQVVTNFYQSRQSADEARCWRKKKADEIFAARFGKDDALTIDLARTVLDAVHQEGKYATKYSNIYDLTNGDIYLYCNHDFDNVVKLNLAKELAKGARTIALPSLFEDASATVIPDLEPYLGRYADTAEDRTVTVIEQKGTLAVDVPAQGVLELTPPDRQGLWHLAVAPQVAMSFVRGDDGTINIMTCHKGGFEFEMLREGYLPPAEIDVKHAARYVGKYHSELRSVDFEVRIQNNRLALCIPGQAIFELHPPDKEGKHSFRSMSLISVAFHDAPEGHVESMTLHKPGEEETLTRLDIVTSTPPRDPDFVDWAKEKAVRLDSLDWSRNDPKTFAFLDEALKGKRIVFLGEMDHFVAERMEYRLLLIRELAGRGFRRIGAEMGLSDAKRMDRFLETGDETWLDRVALYGYRGDKRTDRNDEVAGWTDNSHPEFTRTVLDETRWFLSQLRKINEELPAGKPRLEWFGYDLSFHPGGGYADAGELLAPHEENPLARKIKERMALIPGESRIDEAVRLEGLVAMLDANREELVAMTGEADALELRRSLQRMADAFRFIDGLGDLKKYDPEVVAAALSKRERRMDHNFDEHLAEWPADEKIILLGHSLHLSKESESIETESFGPMWKSIGTYLAEKLPGQVYGIWLLLDHGRHGLPRGVPPVQSFRSPQDSVERLLAEIHPILMLPLGSADPREKWLDEKRTVSYGGGPVHTVLPRQTDCLFFIERANEPGQRRRDAPRAQEDKRPKAERVLDAYVEVTGGKAAYAGLRDRIEEITVEVVGSGMTFSMTAFYARPDKAYFLIEGEPIGKIERGTDGEVAWESSSTAGPVIKKGAARADMLRSAVFDRVTQWRKLFEKAEYAGVESVDGKACHKIVLTPETGEPETHYYDRASMLVVKAETIEQDAVPYELFFSDYREVDGVLFPHTFRRVSMGQEIRLTFDSIRHNVDIAADRFELPDDVRALLAGNTPDLTRLNVASFEKVFRIVNDYYWDPEFGGLDWQAVGDELRPQIMEASTLPEARAILGDMISRLKLSHFAIIPTDSRKEGEQPKNDGAPGGETGIDARVIDHKALVTSVDEGSSAERLGVRPGWEIVRINDFDVVARIKELDRQLPDTPSKRVKMAGEMIVRVRSGVGESVAVTFRDGDGDLADLTIPFGEPSGRNAKVGNFGHARVRIDVKTLGDNIGYIAVNKFLDPAYVMKTFNDALESFMDADGIILDLRGNSGGKDAMAMGMMGWLAPSEWVAGRLRTRGNETEMIVRPRARTYDGPVAVLTDGLTGSSAEFVAAALQEMARACVIGTRTKGEALPAEYTTLPNGDVFLYAVADFVTGAGKRLEGVGVAPDIEVALTQGSLLEGRDIVLEAAVNWIRTHD